MCFSSPVYRVIIGNVRGACQMLPYPDWKAENQQGARARTSGNNNNEDDHQGGDMPKWMFKKQSNQEELYLGQPKKNDDHARQDVSPRGHR